jgi:hypothetical protein
MARKEGLLGLVPFEANPNSSSNGSLQLFAPDRTLTRDEQRTVDELHKQQLVIQATNTKTTFAMDQIADIHEHATAQFDSTTGYILRIKDQQRGAEHQLYVDEFTKHQIPSLARQLMAAVEVAANAIGMEVHRPLYLPPEPPEPPKPRSLREILFG